MAGMLLGQLLVRALGRAERIHAAMRCRGFDGEVRLSRAWVFSRRDVLFVAATAALLLASRAIDVPALVGRLGGLR
jgi:cobalt/nickel transport system permease protein